MLFIQSFIKKIKGTIDGVYEINRPYDGDNQSPGEMELSRNQNTAGQKEMIWEIGYGHRFKLLEGKAGSLKYSPSIALGLSTGSNYSSVLKENEWWVGDSYQESYRIQGFGGTASNKIEYTVPSGRFGLFYENNLGLYKQRHGFLDGHQEYNLKFMGNNIGIVFQINKTRKKK